MERYVEMMRRTPDGLQVYKKGEFVLREGETTVEYVGDPLGLRGILDRDGAIPDRLNKLGRGSSGPEGRVKMTDGLAFLENLPYNFIGSRFWATKVKTRKASK